MATKIIIPKMGANIEQVEIGRVYISKGDSVKKGQPLFEIITDKASYDVESEFDGTVLELQCKQGDKLNVLDEVGYIGGSQEAILPLPKKENISLNKAVEIRATPLARKLAKEKGIILEEVFKGYEKIIKEEDVLNLSVNIANQNKLTFVEISDRKKSEILNLSHSKENITSTVTFQYSYDKVMKKIEDISNMDGYLLSFSEFVSYNVIKSIEKFRKLNSYFEEGKIFFYDSISPCIAFGINEDLFIPVIEKAENLSLHEFSLKSKEIALNLIKKQRLQETKGTFTITNLSSFGVLDFYPVISHKQSSILGIGGKYDGIKIQDNTLIPERKFNLVVSYDHRVMNGKYVSEFLSYLRDLLEN